MELYTDFAFGPAPENRPYVVVDMVSTIDGKILSGERNESVMDLGSDVDHRVMRKLQDAADGVMIGAGTLRATPSGWNPRTRFRVVVSGSGKVDTSHSFFGGGKGIAITGPGRLEESGLNEIHFEREIDPAEALRDLHRQGCRKLLLLGGSETNALFLRQDLVDEIFLTIAPKVKLGSDVPTIAGGEPLGRDQLLQFTLVEHHAVGDEIFLRYRRAKER